MAVETPQLQEPVYQQQMAAPPMPEGVPAQVLPAQAGFVSKAGAGAYIANNVLQGWLKGREVRAQKELQKAQTQLRGADYAYQSLADNYNNLLKQGKAETDPDVQKAREAAVAAWNSKLQVMGQYAAPQEPAKKTTKQKVEGGFGQLFGKSGVTPQLLAQSSLQVLKASPPPGLGLTPQDRLTMTQEQVAKEELKGVTTTNELNQLKLDVEKQNAADDTTLRRITSTPEADRTLADRQWLDLWQKRQMLKEPMEQQLADKISQKIINGQPLEKTEASFAYAKGLLQGPRTEMRTDASGKDQLVTISPDGQVLGTVTLGRHYEPDQVGPAMRLLKAQQDFAVRSLVQATVPDIAAIPADKRTKDQQDKYNEVYKEALQTYQLEQARMPTAVAAFLGDNPIFKEKAMNAISKAIETVWNNAGGMGANPAQRSEAQAVMSNFVTGDPKGAGHWMAFRDQMAGPVGTSGIWWWQQPKFAGGVNQEKLASQQAAFYEQVRKTLQEQNPTWTPTQLDAAMPQWLKTPGGQPAQAKSMSPFPFHMENGMPMFGAPPAAPGVPEANTQGVYGNQGPGTQLYNVQTSDGARQAWMTPADAAAAQDAGFQVQAQ